MVGGRSNTVKAGKYKVRLNPESEEVLADVKPGIHPTVNVRPESGRHKKKWLILTLGTFTMTPA